MRAYKNERWGESMPQLQAVNDRLLEDFAPLESPLKKFPETTTTEMTLRIGIMTFTVECRTPGMARILYRRFARFLGNPEASTLRLVCESKSPASADGMTGLEKDSVERRSSYWILRTSHFEASYFPRYHMAWAAVPENIEQLLRLFKMLFTVWMQERGGLLVQAMTVSHDHRSFVFVDGLNVGGGSLALTSQPELLLGDEYSLLFPLPANGFAAVEAPFGDELSKNENVAGDLALAGIYFLDEAAPAPVVPLTPQDAFPRLMHNVLGFSKDMQSIDQTRSNAHRLLESTPLFKVSSRGDRPVNDLLNSTGEPGGGRRERT